jgi:hypothetical protein
MLPDSDLEVFDRVPDGGVIPLGWSAGSDIAAEQATEEVVKKKAGGEGSHELSGY